MQRGCPPRFVQLSALAVALVLGAGCGGNDEPARDAAVDVGERDFTVDMAPEVDSLPPDLAKDKGAEPDGPQLPSNMGEGCARNVDCKPGSPLCLTVDKEANVGLCSRECKPDDPQTDLIDEDSCPEGFICSEFRFGEETYQYCLKRCQPSLKTNPCPATSKTTCHPVSTRFTNVSQTVCFFAACTDNKDCPLVTASTCVKDAECASVPGGDAFCDVSVRRCVRPGNCTAGGLCGPHAVGDNAAKVGDPCNSDMDCPNNGVCLLEQVDGARTFYRNGYCAVRFCSFAADMPEYACPVGSSCHKLFYGGLCHKNCDLSDAKACRGHAGDLAADYECYAWNNLFIGGEAVTASPVCQAAGGQTCDSLGAQLTCASLGLDPNTTSMRCRDPLTGADLAAADPGGLCLDDTPSGAFSEAADGGVDGGGADAGAADSGPLDASVTVDASATDQSATDQSATDQSATDQSATDQSATDQSATDQSATDQSATDAGADG